MGRSWKSRIAGTVPALTAWVVLGALAAAGLAVYKPVTVAGGSMHPSLHVGDIVLVRRGSPIGVGDIVLVATKRHGDVLHRVSAITSDSRLATRGDANPVADFVTLPRDAAQGRVELVVPAGRLLEGWR
jgi:signal peptidase I